MNKPYGRKTKIKVGQILSNTVRSAALEKLKQIPDEQLTGHLFSHLYNKSELIKFRSAVAMGFLSQRIAETNIEKARIILRRIMWNLNDESGGIGWGSPEAMGEILSNCPDLALEFKSILFSYLEPMGNFIEHTMLQRGVLWGIGTYLRTSPQDLTDTTQGLLFSHLHSDDAVKRAYAVRALINAGCFDCAIVPEDILKDNKKIEIFDGWDFIETPVKDLALSCSGEKIFA